MQKTAKKPAVRSKKPKTPVFVVPRATSFVQIDPQVEKTAKENAWSVESMPGHDAAGRGTKYIGSNFAGYMDESHKELTKVFDYFIDSSGEYWYGVRVLLPSGELIGMEEYLFGKNITQRKEY